MKLFNNISLAATKINGVGPKIVPQFSKMGQKYNTWLNIRLFPNQAKMLTMINQLNFKIYSNEEDEIANNNRYWEMRRNYMQQVEENMKIQAKLNSAIEKNEIISKGKINN
jgi:hypothetical protein